MAYSPSGQRIAAKCWGSSVFVWDQAGVRFVPNDRSGVVGTAWASEDELVYLVSNGGATLHKVKEPDLTVSPAKPIERAAYTCPPVISPEGQTVLSSHEGDLFDADSGKTLVKPADLSGVSSLVFHPSGRLLTGLENGDVLIWDLGQGKLERRLTVPGQIRGLALSSDGQRLAVASNADNDVRLFDFKSGRQTGVVKTEYVRRAGWAMAFNPSGDLLAVHQENPSSWADHLVLYNVRSGEQVWKTEKTNAFAFHPREHKWAVLRKEGLVEIDLRSGQETLHKIKSLKDVAYDSKGDLFAVQCFGSGRGSNLLKMYPVSTGRLDEGQVVRNWPRFSADRLSYGARERCWWLRGDSGALFQLDENGKDLGHLPEATTGFGDFTWQSLPNGLVAVRSGKGTVDFWRGNQLAPEGQLVLLEGGKNWLCTSANGFFDGTDAAERLVEWQVGNKRYRVDQFFQQGYRPGLLREFYRGAKLSRAEGPLMSVMAPPKLEILSPAPGARLDNRDTEVRVRLVDQGDGCSNPKIFINGHAVAASQTRSESADVYVFKTKLQPGVNEIRATGFDKSGRVESRGDKLRVTCTAEVRRKPQLWVLAVGVNKASSGRPLQFAEGDAQAIGAKLKSDLYEASQVTVLTGANANKSKLDEAFREMEAKAEPQDTVVVFFAGHGVAESAGYRFLLAGKNPDLDSLTSTELASYLESVPAHRQLVVLDTCHSAAASPELASRFAVTQQRMARGSGTFMLAACRSNETAAEIPSLKHGILTHSLLNGFGNKGASSNPQGQITVNSLIQFVSSDFPEVTRRFAQSQELYQFGNGSDFPLVKKGS
jgi:WD40 repeat protein